MFCEKCGKPIAPGSSFCSACGATVSPVTPPVRPTAPPQTAAPSRPIAPPQPAGGQPIGQPIGQPGSQPIGQPGGQTGVALPPTAPKKGGGRTGLIIAISVVLALLVAGAVILAIFLFKDKDKKGGEETTTAAARVTEPTEDATAGEAEDPSEAEPASEAEPEPVTDAPAEDRQKYEPGRYINSTFSIMNLRAEHNTFCDIIGKIGMGQTITVTDVYENPDATDPTVRWWGRTTAGGRTGWVALFYFSCLDLKDNVYSLRDLQTVWKQLAGYWNTLDDKRFACFSEDTDGLRMLTGNWYSEADFIAHADGDVRGDLRGLLSVHFYEPAQGNPDTYYYEEIDTTVLLDLSEIENGRVSWKIGADWETGTFAGSDMEEAQP